MNVVDEASTLDDVVWDDVPEPSVDEPLVDAETVPSDVEVLVIERLNVDVGPLSEVSLVVVLD